MLVVCLLDYLGEAASGHSKVPMSAKLRPQTADFLMTISNALTVDVEDYFHVSAFSSSIHRDTWENQESRVEKNTEKLLAIFESFEVKATFFVLGWVAERHPGLIKDIEGQGHEIACHGWSHHLVYQQSPEEFREETLRAKTILEDITGKPVQGYRAASYSIVRDSLWALDTLADLGFIYDSSIFPIRHDRYGMPDAKRVPHQLATPNGSSIVEWPLSTARLLGMSLPVCGGGYFRLFPYWLNRWGLQAINRDERRPFIFYLHPWEVDPRQPRMPSKLLSRFRHYTNLDKVEMRLNWLLSEFRFGTVIEGLRGLGLVADR